MLYPNRQLPRFLEKNRVDSERVGRSKLLAAMIGAGDSSIICQDIHGEFHFNGDFRNAADLNAALDQLSLNPVDSALVNSALVNEERGLLNDLFEETFVHRDYTGRSGTFFAYEGLGSI